jgi:hypothetical protein
MAEIKSTLDMVMERAARMAAASDVRTDSDELHKTGMRLAADFLNQKIATEPAAVLAGRGQEEQAAIRKGMVETLLRNITLPRDENLKATSILALKGILSLGGPQLSSTCTELQQILEQYNQHKEQATQQLDDAIRAQLGQQMAKRGGQAAQGAAINPALHPQYREEVARMQGDLNNQYTQALDQRKEVIRQHLARLS